MQTRQAGYSRYGRVLLSIINLDLCRPYRKTTRALHDAVIGRVIREGRVHAETGLCRQRVALFASETDFFNLQHLTACDKSRSLYNDVVTCRTSTSSSSQRDLARTYLLGQP